MRRRSARLAKQTVENALSPRPRVPTVKTKSVHREVAGNHPLQEVPDSTIDPKFQNVVGKTPVSSSEVIETQEVIETTTVAGDAAKVVAVQKTSRKRTSKKSTVGSSSSTPHGPTKNIENDLRDSGEFKVVAGVDEAGRGPLAGPVVTAACVVPKHVFFEGVGDSKQVSEKDRERLFDEIINHPEVSYSIAQAPPTEIDEYNILQATLRAMSRAVAGLSLTADYVLVDGPHVPKDLPEYVKGKQGVVKGDSRVYAIACASILAKVTRDRIMVELDKEYPMYGFAKHKGYPTAAHRKAVADFGPTLKVHRYSFGPVRIAAERQAKNSDGEDSSKHNGKKTAEENDNLEAIKPSRNTKKTRLPNSKKPEEDNFTAKSSRKRNPRSSSAKTTNDEVTTGDVNPKRRKSTKKVDL